MDTQSVRSFIAALEDRPADERSVERARILLASLQRPDVRYLVGSVLGPGAGPIARVARGVLEAAGARTAVLAAEALIGDAPLDDPLVANAGTLVAAAAYQLAADHPALGELGRREAVVLLGLTAFAEASQRVALLLDPAIDARDPIHAPVPDLVVIGRVGAARIDAALGLVPDGRPAVSAPQEPEARERLERIAKERGLPLLLGERDFQVSREAEGVSVTVGDESYRGLPLAPGVSEEELATGIAAALGLGVLGIRMREEWVVAGCRMIAS